jgi:hypothetical protein
MGAPIGRGGFLDLPKGHRADQHAVALDECEIRGNDKLGRAQHLPNARRGIAPSRQTRTALDSA